MKKFFTMLLAGLILVSFSACSNLSFQKEEETVVEPAVTEAKSEPEAEKIEAETQEPEKNEEIDELKSKIEELEKKLEDKKSPVVEKKEYTGANYITLNKPANDSTFSHEPIIFTGVVSPNTKKIAVEASGNSYTDNYTLQDFDYGDSSFTYRAKGAWNNLELGTNDYEFTAYFDDGSEKSTKVTIYFNGGVAEMGKPVIYLYPTESMRVSVNVKPVNGISVSEPKIGSGWKVIANPDGEILNIADRKFYPYLFWEGFAANFKTPEEGFVISRDEVSKFFDEKLEILGLNEKEIGDFKEFWIPRLSEDPYYFVTFIPQEEFDRYAPLSISPKPDSIIRVFFDYKGLSEKVDVVEQKLVTPERTGFSAIEWGGRLYR